MGGAGASKFPELAPSPGWGSCDLEAGKEGNACASTSSIPLIGPLPVYEAQCCPSFRNTYGINSGEGNQRVFPKNALSGLWHLRESWHLSSSVVGLCLELFQ